MVESQNCYVVTDLSRPLLGWPAIEQLNLLARVGTVEQPKLVAEKFLKLFTGLGKLPEEYTIKLLDEAKPHSLNVSQCIAIPLMEALKPELKHMEQLEVIAQV